MISRSDQIDIDACLLGRRPEEDVFAADIVLADEVAAVLAAREKHELVRAELEEATKEFWADPGASTSRCTALEMAYQQALEDLDTAIRDGAERAAAAALEAFMTWAQRSS